ncbi:transcription factor bHLH18-like [Camellia sinensis]|uniref:transcription factor bHLH18-like n=1 Tax=Camellia sinensis TaxID=4442 RepID=UPI0010366D70|nr:transcription factor bHLH18-like [Camellia sinensis]
MDAFPAGWLYDLGMEDQYDISIDEFDFQSFSPESYKSSLNSTELEQLDTNIWNTSRATENIAPNESSTPPYLLSFAQSDSPSAHSAEQFNENPSRSEKPKDHEMVPEENTNLSYLSSHGSDDNSSDTLERRKWTKSVRAFSRPPLQAKNHVVAERKRREKLNQKLIALSALIPGLKKMDKASILVDATNYIKQLGERVQTLEREAKKIILVEPTKPSVKRFRLSSTDINGTCLSDDNIDGNSNNINQSPEIEARVSDKHVLVRIHCKKQDGLIAKILSELDKFCLDVISSSTMPFGDTALDITIIAQMGDELKVKDLVKNLSSAVLKSV